MLSDLSPKLLALVQFPALPTALYKRWDAGWVCHPEGWDGWSVTVLWQVQEITVVTSKCLHWGSLQMAGLELIFHRKHKWSHCNKELQMLGVADTFTQSNGEVTRKWENPGFTCFRTLISNDHVLSELSKSWEKARYLLIKIFHFSNYSTRTQYTQNLFLKKRDKLFKKKILRFGIKNIHQWHRPEIQIDEEGCPKMWKKKKKCFFASWLAMFFPLSTYWTPWHILDTS